MGDKITKLEKGVDVGVSLVRCDDRLIHGQVIVRVLKTFSITKIVVVDESIGSDAVMTNIYRMSVPPGVELQTTKLSQAKEKIEQAIAASSNALILCRTPQVALGLFKNYPGLKKEFNIGPMSNRKGSIKATVFAYLLPEEVQDIEKIESMGIRVYFRQVADQDEVGWEQVKRNFTRSSK